METRDPIDSRSEDAELDLIRARLEAALRRERGLVGRLRALSTEKRSSLVVVSVAVAVSAVAVFLGRADLGVYPVVWLAVPAALYALLLGGVFLRVLRPLHYPERSQSNDVALGCAALAVPFSWALWAPAGTTHANGGNDCLLLGLVLGAFVILLLRAFDRDADNDRRAAALAAAAGGLTANLALLFHCPRSEALHLALVHAPIGVWLMLAYLWRLGRVWRMR